MTLNLFPATGDRAPCVTRVSTSHANDEKGQDGNGSTDTSSHCTLEKEQALTALWLGAPGSFLRTNLGGKEL